MSELETAANPQTLRRVAIEPVTRVEGHGKVTILLDDNNKVHQVRLHVVEFRGFETFIEGRPFWEVPVMVQRLCGICPVSHHLASAKAMDIIVGAPVLTPSAEKLRRLLHYGQTLQSHAVHFFHLASPDLLLGFDSDHTRRNIVAVAAGFPEIAKQGVLLRKYGQEVIRIVAGKRVHGAVAVPGGMNKPLASEYRDLLRRDIDRMISWSRDAVQLLKRMYDAEPAFYNGFGAVDSNMLALVGAKGAMDLYHGKLRARDADGGIVFDGVEYAGYQQIIQEEVKPWSYMKFPHIKSLGKDDGWYKVGPLARLQTCDSIPTALAEVERQNLLAVANGRPAHGALSTTGHG
jgi:NAD-reducing hydrogenase large subunit